MGRGAFGQGCCLVVEDAAKDDQASGFDKAGKPLLDAGRLEGAGSETQTASRVGRRFSPRRMSPEEMRGTTPLPARLCAS